MDYTKINTSSFRFEDVDMLDYPDFTDAYLAYAEWKTGEQLSDEELDELNEEHREFLYDFILGDAIW